MWKRGGRDDTREAIAAIPPAPGWAGGQRRTDRGGIGTQDGGAEVSPALAVMAACAAAAALWGLAMRSRMFAYPTALGLLYLLWVVPQAIAAERAGYGALYGTDFAWAYMTACLIAAVAGFALGKGIGLRGAARAAHPEPVEGWLVIGAAGLTGIGILAARKVAALDAALDLGSEWTGVITLHYLLIQTLFYGLAIAALRYAATGRRAYLAILLVALAAALSIFGGNVKRHMIAEVAIVLAGARFLVRGRQPPLLAALPALALGAVLLQQVAAVRAHVWEEGGTVIGAFASGAAFEGFSLTGLERGVEITQAVSDIRVANLTGAFEGPAETYNKLVHQYVPAFLLGRAFKEGLKIPVRAQDPATGVTAHYSPGATRTGFSETYRGYGVLGCLVFGLVGATMGRLYASALAGWLPAQFYYLVLLNDAMLAVTESVARTISILPFMLAVTLPVFWLAAPSGRPGPVAGARRAA